MSTPAPQTAFDLVAQAKSDLQQYGNDAGALAATNAEIATLQGQAGTQTATVASDIEKVNADLDAASAALLALKITAPSP